MSDYLCEELIVEILTRLPAKSFLRFRTLCKSLCSCIASPCFIRMHTLRSPQKLIIRHQIYNKKECCIEYFYTLQSEDQLLVCSRRGYVGVTPLEFPSRYFDILGSCNGLLCLFDYRKGIISLWNPSIRRTLILPNWPGRFSMVYSMSEIGFGFDPITDDYKIVRLSLANDRGVGQSSCVYAVKIGAWCAIASPTPLISDVISRACFIDGVLHWVVEPHITESDDTIDPRYILTFDLSTHVFGMIALPKPNSCTGQLTTIQGSLAVITLDYGNICIWVRKDASWSLVLKSNIDLVQGQLHQVVQSTNNGDLLLKTSWDKTQVYNPKTGARSRLVDFNVASCIGDIQMCVESLQLFDMGTACETKQLSFLGEKKRSKRRLFGWIRW